jgi:hypothetical protein
VPRRGGRLSQPRPFVKARFCNFGKLSPQIGGASFAFCDYNPQFAKGVGPPQDASLYTTCGSEWNDAEIPQHQE